MAEKAKVPKAKGLKASLKGVPPVALIGVPVVAGVAFWLYNRKKKATAASTTTAAAPADTAQADSTGSTSYSDPNAFAAAIGGMQGDGSRWPDESGQYGQRPSTTGDGTPDSTGTVPGATPTPGISKPIISPAPSTPDVTPGTTPEIPDTGTPVGGNVVEPSGIAANLGVGSDQGASREPTPSEQFIKPPVKVNTTPRTRVAAKPAAKPTHVTTPKAVAKPAPKTVAKTIKPAEKPTPTPVKPKVVVATKPQVHATAPTPRPKLSFPGRG